jgi:hypothetical protein
MLDFLYNTVLPEAIELDLDFVAVAQDVASPDGAVWVSQTGDGNNSIFLCLSPQDALWWLCKYSSRDLLLQAIQDEYDGESPPASERSTPRSPLSPAQVPKRKRKAKGDGPSAGKYNKTLD